LNFVFVELTLLFRRPLQGLSDSEATRRAGKTATRKDLKTAAEDGGPDGKQGRRTTTFEQG
jgi:hypothetical protein